MNWQYAYANRFPVLAAGLDMFRLGAIAKHDNDPVRQFVLYKNNFSWMDDQKLIPEGIRSLWLKASVAWWGGGGIILAEGLHDWGRWALPLFQSHPGIYHTTEEMHEKPIGYLVRVAGQGSKSPN
jgi:hypothetical protein